VEGNDRGVVERGPDLDPEALEETSTSPGRDQRYAESVELAPSRGKD
jgi:hypothetical protein